MLNILIASNHPDRLATIARLVNECAGYDANPLSATPAQLLASTSALDGYNVLIIDLPDVRSREILDIQALCHQVTKLTCMLVTSEPSPDLLIAAMRAGVRDVVAWPVEKNTLADALSRAVQQHTQESSRKTRTISFISCKGGTGTSFLASNVGYLAGATRGKRVLLVDLAQEFSDAAFLVSEKVPPATLPEVSAQAERIDASFLDSCVMHIDPMFDLLAGAGDPIKAAQITESSMKLIFAAAARRYDLVVFDLGQVINPLSVFALDHSDQVCVVTHANMPHLRAGKRLLDILRSLDIPMNRIQLVLNRSSRRNTVTHAELEKVFGMRPLAVLPDDFAAVSTATNQGIPVAKLFKRSAIARGLAALAAELVSHSGEPAAANAHGKSLLGKLFHRARTDRPKLA